MNASYLACGIRLKSEELQPRSEKGKLLAARNLMAEIERWQKGIENPLLSNDSTSAHYFLSLTS
jgi:hypothetical protein